MTGYPDNWAVLSWQVRFEANDHCEDCWAPDDRETGYMLTVHHLDGDKTNCSRENLKALCQRCHLKRQGRLRLYGPEDDRQLRFPLIEAMASNPQRHRHDPRRMTMIA